MLRLDGVIKHYDAAGVNHGAVYKAPEKVTKDGSTVETSLGVHENQWAELAFDGRADTFFWADRDLRKDDHFTIHLKTPTAVPPAPPAGSSASRNGDRLENGVLEASADGNSWTEIASFSAGKATGKAAPGTHHLRIRVTAPQTDWLIIDEVIIK